MNYLSVFVVTFIGNGLLMVCPALDGCLLDCSSSNPFVTELIFYIIFGDMRKFLSVYGGLFEFFVKTKL